MKLLLFQLGKIGDLILQSAILPAIKEKFPQSTIHLLAGKHNYPIAGNINFIDKLYVYDKSLLNTFKLISSIRKENYDYWIDTKDHPSSESKYFALISNAKVKIGFNKVGDNTFDYGLPGDAENYKLHYVEKCYRALAPMGIDMPKAIPCPQLIINPKEKLKIESLKQRIGNYLLINISASAPSRIWRDENWIEFINHSAKKYPVVLSSAPNDFDKAEHISCNTKDVLIYKSNNLSELVALTAFCEMIITPDTSLVHIAAAFDKPIICLFKGTEKNYIKFRPLSTKNQVLKTQGDTDINSISPNSLLEVYNNFII